MTIEVANKLVKLRKENGLSQEDLAAKLGISRQAVSKWERAEASPDTDNLICLAKLYNVSLDELLKTDDTIEDIKEDQLLKNEESKDNNININGKDISINENTEISGDNIKIKQDGKIRYIKSEEAKKESRIAALVCGVIMLTTLIIYVLLSVLYDTSLWKWLWVILLIGPIVSSIIDVIHYKNIKKFNIAFVAVMIYIILGFLKDLWHPAWIVFLVIPAFYILANIINKNFGIEDDEEEIEETE